MIKKFKLSDGSEGTIEMDDKLIELMGDDWAEAKIAMIIAERESNLSKSQE